MMVAIAGALPSKSLPILDLVEREGPLSFTEIQKALDLKPSTTDRALKALAEELLVHTTMEFTSSLGGHFHYQVSERGRALLRSVRAYRRALERERGRLGDLVRRLDPLAT